jgi:hypothetical protein
MTLLSTRPFDAGPSGAGVPEAGPRGGEEAVATRVSVVEDGRTVLVSDASGRTRLALVPVWRPGRHGTEHLGAFAVTGDRVEFRPALDTRHLVTAASVAAVATCVAVAVVVTGRRPVVGPVSMGPGGWVSVKGVRGRVPALRTSRATPAAPRPVWARLLRARRLVVQP